MPIRCLYMYYCSLHLINWLCLAMNLHFFYLVAIIGGVAGAMAVILIVCVVAIAVHCTR